MPFKDGLLFYFYSFIACIIYFCVDVRRFFESLQFSPLPCNGVLCAWHLRYVHVTCCYCRSRRRALGKFKNPIYYLEYTYRAFYKSKRVKSYVFGNVKDNGVWRGGVEAKSNQTFEVTEFETLRIDPRGKMLSVKVAAIQVLDKIMLRTRIKIPLVEVCEFLANYP
jgi:hypothetical protein